MEIIPIKTRKITPEDDLIEVLMRGLSAAKIALQDGDIVAIVSKIVALTEGGLVDIRGKKISKKSRYGTYKDSAVLIDYIKSEADLILEGDMFLTIKNNIFTPSGGVDTSNVPEGYAIGWPKNPYASAEILRKKILSGRKIKKIGVLIFDSYIIPLRNGVTGISLGYSGFQGAEDYRGKKDLFGNTLRVTQKNISDGLSAAATVVTGEGRESIPFVIIRKAPVKFVKRVSRTEMICEPKDCLYRVLYPKEIL
ncbi:MAG: coenzyme F420-0:L-glutamate ligase [Candidatus Peregrinibacteria bacterium]|nr:coenzyme F420-0:L-glutamate ligase [Candidatus Peregrinibacteria bacterium]